MTVATDLARLALGTAVLAFASWTDWRWRRAPNVLWVLLGGAGLAFLAIDAATSFERVAADWRYLVAAPVFVVLVYALWRLHLVAGGADAKALMAIAVLVPFPLRFDGLPLLGSPMPGAMAVLGNSLLAFLLVPVGYALWNLANGRFRFPHVLLGTEIAVADLGRGHAWPMERVVDGAVRTQWFPKRGAPDASEVRAGLEAAGRTRTWVTPKVPFMIPLLVGFVSAFVVGDALMALVSAALR